MKHRRLFYATLADVQRCAGTLTRLASNGYDVTFHGDRQQVADGADVVIDGDDRIAELALHHVDPSRMAMLAFEAGVQAERFDAIRRRQRRREQRGKPRPAD